jgi:pimeloyl-ACP methyl ester carboxylesterase
MGKKWKEKVVVFLPGIYSSASFVFANAAKALESAGCRTLFIEYPHKEKNIRQWPDWKITQVSIPMVLVECRHKLSDLAQQNSDSQLYLVGHSTGGTIAMSLAASSLYNSNLGGVAAIGPAPAENMDPIPISRKQLINFWPGILLEILHLNLPVYRTFGGARRIALPRDLSRAELKTIWKQMRWESLHFLQAIGNRKGRKPPYVNFKEIFCPTLLIGCRQDRLVPLEVPKQYHGFILGSDYKEIEAAHYPFWGKAGNEMNRILADFITHSK